ncbi:ATP-binding protein [Gloeobacter kilaueensis]|uniref:ATPase (AAA+ superfamily) n=1 Tax=Gloeobacter kilaueensis (strain ATCC BAA-2537 / CCAP 1431/1 / ULC 316 / JS1) TaxID=1183438 RepID=U5QRW1_GLOK1|nr:ATP-binding protein [Gloeobacter kilaueensis]AGY60430.1 ATPase (AAA+ superfamily) [Gloeobacter kilaueensis JS1]
MGDFNDTVRRLRREAASLLIYQEVLTAPPVRALLGLLDGLGSASPGNQSQILRCLEAYGLWFKTLAERAQSWPDALVEAVLQADNPFSAQLQHCEVQVLPPALVEAARHDLQILQRLHDLESEQIALWMEQVTGQAVPLPHWPKVVPFFDRGGTWAEALPRLALHYREAGIGLFARYRALRWQAGELVGIAHPEQIRSQELVGYEQQRDTLRRNTEFLLAGYPALHVLLYGSRGSGKSSLVKSMLSEYAERGLRLIEVAKSELQALPLLIDHLRPLALKFVLFVDDLSFEEGEEAYKALKVVLEGNLTARPQNVVVYATSNRRHLIREFFGDRPRPSDEEVHAWDTVQEKLSFSDRFGLTLTFEPADQKTYLRIVRYLAEQAGIALAAEDLERRALQWVMHHNSRSGRTARQFIDFLRSELALAGAPYS